MSFNFIVKSIITTLFLFTVSSNIIKAQDDFSDDLAVGETITVTGVVKDASGDAIAGANVVVEGTDIGSATDEDGNFSIEDVSPGSELTASVIGYENQSCFADTENVVFELNREVLEMSQLEVLASRAGDKTAVAYSNVSKEDIALRLGSQDIPLALNTIPSVYSTNQGGGAGDARINVRGFNQRNVAVMINGIPVNDMENGWVFGQIGMVLLMRPPLSNCKRV